MEGTMRESGTNERLEPQPSISSKDTILEHLLSTRSYASFLGLRMLPEVSVDSNPGWSTTRLRQQRILSSWPWELMMSLFLLFHLVLVVHQTDIEAAEGVVPRWLEIANYFLLAAYGVDVSARLYVCRSAYFQKCSNVFDLVVVWTDIMLEILNAFIGDTPSFWMFRWFRVIRFVRGLRFLSTQPAFHELFLMVHGLKNAFKAVLWALVLMWLMLTFWSVLAVEIIHPLNRELADERAYDDCKRCAHAYETVFASTLTFIQSTVAGDSWGETALPIMERHPWTTFFFIAVFATMTLGLMNLVLTVIVDAAHQARVDDSEHQLEIKARERTHGQKRLLRMFAEIDRNRDGVVTYEELLEAFEHDTELRKELRLMDINREEISVVYEILDEDRSGEVDYKEFTRQLYKMKEQDSHTILMMIKHWTLDSRRKLSKLLATHFDQHVSTLIATLEKIVEDVASPLRGSTFANELKTGAQESPNQMNMTVSVSAADPSLPNYPVVRAIGISPDPGPKKQVNEHVRVKHEHGPGVTHGGTLDHPQDVGLLIDKGGVAMGSENVVAPRANRCRTPEETLAKIAMFIDEECEGTKQMPASTKPTPSTTAPVM